MWRRRLAFWLSKISVFLLAPSKGENGVVVLGFFSTRGTPDDLNVSF
jgi:hypothetical protein